MARLEVSLALSPEAPRHRLSRASLGLPFPPAATGSAGLLSTGPAAHGKAPNPRRPRGKGTGSAASPFAHMSAPPAWTPDARNHSPRSAWRPPVAQPLVAPSQAGQVPLCSSLRRPNGPIKGSGSREPPSTLRGTKPPGCSCLFQGQSWTRRRRGRGQARRLNPPQGDLPRLEEGSTGRGLGWTGRPPASQPFAPSLPQPGEGALQGPPCLVFHFCRGHQAWPSVAPWPVSLAPVYLSIGTSPDAPMVEIPTEKGDSITLTAAHIHQSSSRGDLSQGKVLSPRPNKESNKTRPRLASPQGC